MRVLVTGAAGFLGRYVVSALVDRGHSVRALVRQPERLDAGTLPADVEIASSDLLIAESILSAVRGCDVVIHLAIGATNVPAGEPSDTLKSTANLLHAMEEVGISRFAHCSSFSVYDWSQASGVLDEASPLEANLAVRDGYAQTKIAQEHLVAEFGDKHKWQVAMLRPGFIWGKGRLEIAGLGYSAPGVHLVVADGREVPLTYVENCAECFAVAIEHLPIRREAFNVVDDDLPTAREYMRCLLRAEMAKGIQLNVPFWCGLSLAKLATGMNQAIFGGRAKLPGLLVPSRYHARFRPLKFSNRRAKEKLDWRPRYSFYKAWERATCAQ